MPLPQDTAASRDSGVEDFLQEGVENWLEPFVDTQPEVEWRQYTGSDPTVTDPTLANWVPPYDDATAYATQGDIRAWFARPAERAALLPGGNVGRIDNDVVVFSAVAKGDVLIDAADVVFVIVDVTTPETGAHWVLHARRLG